MYPYHRLRISAAVAAQLAGLFSLAMSLSLFVSHTPLASQQAQALYLFDLGLWLLYGLLAMLLSWLATCSLARTRHRGAVRTLCCSGMAISAALLSLSCAN